MSSRKTSDSEAFAVLGVFAVALLACTAGVVWFIVLPVVGLLYFCGFIH